MVNDIGLLVNGSAVDDVFYPGDGPLTIRIGGQDVPGTTLTTQVDFLWNGDNANGQDLMPGGYFVKVTIKDPFNSATTITKELQLIRVEEYVRVTIYNSGGEIVKQVEMPKTGGDVVDLTVADVFYVGDSNATTSIKFGSNGSFDWDGKNALGDLVGNGTYEVYVEVKSAGGYTVAASKTITVLNQEAGSLLGDLKFYPNPYVFVKGSSGPMRFAWTGTGPGTVRIKIYNVAGELVDKFGADISAGFIDWDMKSLNGKSVASSYYIAFIEAVSGTGAIERRTAKLAVIRTY